MFNIFNWFLIFNAVGSDDHLGDDSHNLESGRASAVVDYDGANTSTPANTPLTPNDRFVQLSETITDFVNVDLTPLTYAEIRPPSRDLSPQVNDPDEVEDLTSDDKPSQKSQPPDEYKTSIPSVERLEGAKEFIEVINSGSTIGSITNTIDLDANSGLRDINFNDKRQRKLKMAFREKNKYKGKKSSSSLKSC